MARRVQVELGGLLALPVPLPAQRSPVFPVLVVVLGGPAAEAV